MRKGYPIGDQSRHQHCVAKLASDVAIVVLRTSTDILVKSSQYVSASLLDKIGLVGGSDGGTIMTVEVVVEANSSKILTLGSYLGKVENLEGENFSGRQGGQNFPGPY